MARDLINERWHLPQVAPRNALRTLRSLSKC